MSERGDGAWPPALLTIPLSLFYSAGAALYHKMWEMRKPKSAGVPVISVGNLTVGGNGKTPFVIAFAKLLMESDPSLCEQNAIAILSRGYGRKERKQVVVEPDSDWKVAGDEPILIKRACPSALVISDSKRTNSARVAVETYGSRVILLDDGFQHRALARDSNIVLLDSEKPLGNGWRLPAGPMRESAEALKRADAIVSVGRGNQARSLAVKLGKPCVSASPQLDLGKIGHLHTGRKCYLLTGIARPERFSALLRLAGVNVAGHKSLADHADISTKILEKTVREAGEAGVEIILTTEKDMVRIGDWKGAMPVVSVPYSIEIVNKDELMGAVRQTTRRR